MDFVDVYGIKHKNCTLVAPAREYQRVVIFMDAVGRRFVAMGPDPQPTKYGSSSQHWHQAQPSAAPEGYFHIDQAD
ncbi:hypothetical protein [Lactiplantibacillus paraplantarum]|uniref:hypothetical protein n=1 Tax=Lactiplantibacillus paraplantarum TaxID=60520 RepID=UPI000D222453|nr:hypothetical protein [Lactiplantibacillus paraplantarum]AVW09066.1 hypothetical protein DA077_00240 [Lactiplantibacillus paraplantarum]